MLRLMVVVEGRILGVVVVVGVSFVDWREGMWREGNRKLIKGMGGCRLLKGFEEILLKIEMSELESEES